ncbi:Uncharacterised protein [Yersinia intermedia]|uniref:hypothetical protein n=1 Tax=Yersinia intermedia TaxID=631 RepID=UPI0005E65CAB|nr:hypothetical protein [Yersinia intermedia]CNJ80443.1 Uncharacterised protein [Yersinia intermedia]
MSKLILIISLCLALAGCEKKTEAPFGLEWGMSSATFPSKYLMTVNFIPQKNGEMMIYTTSVPKEGLGDGSYRFYFKNKKLNRIVFNTYDFLGGNAEAEAKESYSNIKMALAAKFGSPSLIKENIYSEGFNFFPCITNENCGSWFSTFTNKTTKAKVFIGMGLNEEGYSNTRAAGRVSVEYQPMR